MALSRGRTRLISALALVALASIVFGWSSAPASGVVTSVTISRANGAFSGVVNSEAQCLPGRSVTVIKVKTGESVGAATTDGSGRWTVEKKRARGVFRALVAASIVQTGPGNNTGYGYGTQITCDAGQSQDITVKGKNRGGGGGGGRRGDGNLDNLFARLDRLFDRLFGRLNR